jgi:hypothetical protein
LIKKNRAVRGFLFKFSIPIHRGGGLHGIEQFVRVGDSAGDIVPISLLWRRCADNEICVIYLDNAGWQIAGAMAFDPMAGRWIMPTPTVIIQYGDISEFRQFIARRSRRARIFARAMGCKVQI